MKIDINNLTAYQEDHRIEAKAAKNQIPNSIWETYSSFANIQKEELSCLESWKRVTTRFL